MSNYGKSCFNCADKTCRYSMMKMIPALMKKPCEKWQAIKCPLCGGWLGEIQEHKSRKYRHCFACHFEFYADDILEGGIKRHEKADTSLEALA